MFRFFRPISSWFLLTSGWIEPLLVGGYAPFSPVVEYRSVRFGISFYTIWNIVLYDLGYRTIRFWISFYTILNIVLYDSVNRCPVWPKPGWWGGARPLATCKPPLTLPRACRWMFVAATSVTPADGEVHWPWCGLRLCLTIWYIVKCVCFVRLFPCFSIGFSVLGVWHCDTCICKF